MHAGVDDQKYISGLKISLDAFHYFDCLIIWILDTENQLKIGGEPLAAQRAEVFIKARFHPVQRFQHGDRRRLTAASAGAGGKTAHQPDRRQGVDAAKQAEDDANQPQPTGNFNASVQHGSHTCDIWLAAALGRGCGGVKAGG